MPVVIVNLSHNAWLQFIHIHGQLNFPNITLGAETARSPCNSIGNLGSTTAMLESRHCDKKSANAVAAVLSPASRTGDNGTRAPGDDSQKWRLADWNTAATVRSIA